MGSSLIELLLQVGQSPVDPAEIAFDGTQADAQFFGDLALGDAVDAVSAKYGRRARAEAVDFSGDETEVLVSDDASVRRRRIGGSGRPSRRELGPVTVAFFRLPQ